MSHIWLFVLVVLFVVLAAIAATFVRPTRVVEGFNEMVQETDGVWVYSKNNWVTPAKERIITRYGKIFTGQTGVTMTIAFMIKIDRAHSNWRNIFRFGQSYDLEWNNTMNSRNLPYSYAQNIHRRPAVFINPNNTTTLHITHGTNNDWNNWFDVNMGKSSAHVCMVWDLNKCTVYIDGRLHTTYNYSSYLLAPDSDALLYMCDRFYDEGGYAIMNFTIYTRAITANEVGALYNAQPRLDGPWQCVPGYNSPMRKNKDGDVECMSLNARDCLWGGSCAATLATPASQIRPLTCGAHHLREWGITGYDVPAQWCFQVRNRI